jgi:hypothetical protein
VDRQVDLGGKVAHALFAAAQGVQDRLTVFAGKRLAELGLHPVHRT